MKYFVLMNELTLWRALILILMGKRVYLMPVCPLFQISAAWLECISAALIENTKAQSVFEELPEARLYWRIPSYQTRTNMFYKTEKSIEKRFHFSGLDIKIPEYAMAFKHETCKFIATRFLWVLLIRKISEKFDASQASLVISDRDLIFAYETYYNERPNAKVLWSHQFRLGINFCLLIILLTTSFISIASKIRIRKVRPRSFVLGADFTAGLRQIKMVQDIIEDQSQCLFVFRNKMQRDKNVADIDGFHQCLASDGVVSLWEFGPMVWVILRDTLQLYFHFPRLSPEHLNPLLKLPYKRAIYRTLFNKFQFKYFWCRDDYNSDHILRSQELRRVGSCSVGICHGLSSPARVEPAWRYIDFDIYYVLGDHSYRTYYIKTWAQKMKVRALGSLYMSRDYLARLDKPRPKDIIYFVPMSIHEDRAHNAIFDVARAFPEKTVWVKFKPGRNTNGYYREFLEMCKTGPTNLILTDIDSYELMFRASYALSGESTITAESIQFGLCTFALDFCAADEPFYYRDFSGLCVSSAAEVISRITDIETGKEAYPRQIYDPLIKLSGPYIIDAIRDDMGLASLSGACNN